MRRILLLVGLLAGLLVVIAPSVRSRPEAQKQDTPDARQEKEKAGAGPGADRSADEAAIRRWKKERWPELKKKPESGAKPSSLSTKAD